MPKISVIIPTYNAEDMIVETVNAVLAQSFTDFELIVIDDGSKDKTLVQVNAIEDSRIKAFAYDNAGVCAARNRGIGHASGDFISFLDHDDLWTADKLEDQLLALQARPDAGAAYSRVVRMYEQGDYFAFKPSHTPLVEGNIFPNLLRGNFIGNGSNILVRREAVEAIGGFDPDCPYCADWDYCLRLAAHCGYVAVPKNQILYRQVAGSMSSKVPVFEAQGLFMIEKTFRTVAAPFQSVQKQTLSLFYRHCAELYLDGCQGRADAMRAWARWWLAARTYPGVLREGVTWRIALKILLNLSLSPSVFRGFAQLSRKQRASYAYLPKARATIHALGALRWEGQ